jgi:hypothetical protein
MVVRVSECQGRVIAARSLVPKPRTFFPPASRAAQSLRATQRSQSETTGVTVRRLRAEILEATARDSETGE